jgi:comEA protein
MGAANRAAPFIHTHSASPKQMEEKMKYQPFLKWVLPLFCLLLINSMGLTVENAQEKNQQPVNINTASAEELIKIPGVGKSLAQRIIDFREEHGPFKKAEDLLKVRGIGEKNFKKMKSMVTVGKKSK